MHEPLQGSIEMFMQNMMVMQQATLDRMAEMVPPPQSNDDHE
jgi:hypothetical protein